MELGVSQRGYQSHVDDPSEGPKLQKSKMTIFWSDNAVLAGHMGPNDMSRVVVVGDRCVSYQRGGHSALGLKGRRL